jgi:hypothetical protein
LTKTPVDLHAIATIVRPKFFPAQHQQVADRLRASNTYSEVFGQFPELQKQIASRARWQVAPHQAGGVALATLWFKTPDVDFDGKIYF